MRPQIKTLIVTAFAICAGIVFLSSCSKKRETDKDTAQAKAAAPTPTPVQAAAAATEAEAEAGNQQPVAPSGNQRYVLVSSINTLEANREFQKNVDLMQAQRRLAINLNEQIGLATTDETRAALQEQYNQAIAKLNENNRVMLQNYGYSLNRNYLRVIDKSQIHMAVNAEEAARVEANRQENSTPSE